MTAEQLLWTLQLNDTLFPTGGFAYSDGLETAVANGAVTTGAELESWFRHYVHAVFTPCEGLALRRSMEAKNWETRLAIDEEFTAMKPAASSRAGSAMLGKRFLKSVETIHSNAVFEKAEQELANFPVIYGVVFATLGHDVRQALLSFAYSRLAGMTSAALRLMAIGQQEAQRALRTELGGVPAAVEDVMHSDAPLTSFAPRLDIHQMNHRYVYSRLFRS